jgi:hypothetical protein
MSEVDTMLKAYNLWCDVIGDTKHKDDSKCGDQRNNPALIFSRDKCEFNHDEIDSFYKTLRKYYNTAYKCEDMNDLVKFRQYIDYCENVLGFVYPAEPTMERFTTIIM